MLAGLFHAPNEIARLVFRSAGVLEGKMGEDGRIEAREIERDLRVDAVEVHRGADSFGVLAGRV